MRCTPRLDTGPGLVGWQSRPPPPGFRPRIGVRGMLSTAGMTGAGVTGISCFRTDRSARLPPAHQGMKSGSCGLVQRIGTADSATSHPDPCGGQAPALHFLIPPSTIGLQFGTFRPWRAGIEVDWRAHFRTNDENAEWRVQWRAGTPRRRIFVPNRSEPDFILLAALGQPKATFAAPGVTIPLPALSSHTCIAVKSNH